MGLGAFLNTALGLVASSAVYLALGWWLRDDGAALPEACAPAHWLNRPFHPPTATQALERVHGAEVRSQQQPDDDQRQAADERREQRGDTGDGAAGGEQDALDHQNSNDSWWMLRAGTPAWRQG